VRSAAAAPADVTADRESRLADNADMTELTAGEVMTLCALTDNRPKTVDELSRTLSDIGMHLGTHGTAGTVQSLTATGMIELTTAASLGKHRLTARGKAWLASHTAAADDEA
jgi:hypothetical protein